MREPLILGVSVGHDASAALAAGGSILVALQEERLSHVKQHPGFPLRAIGEVLDLAGVRPGELDAVAIGWDRDFLYEIYGPLHQGLALLDPAELPAVALQDVLAFLVQSATDLDAKSRVAEGIIRRQLEWRHLAGVPVEFVSHHRAHAASAYFTCPWDDALVVTSDGKGGGLSATIGRGRGVQLTQNRTTSALDSIGYFYGAVTRYLGYRSNRHEGKITGLAAFGQAGENLAACRTAIAWDAQRQNIVNRLNLRDGDPDEIARTEAAVRRFFNLKEADTIRGILESAGDQRRFRMGYVLLRNHFDDHLASRKPADLAAAAQVLLEEAVTAQVAAALEKPDERLCLAGGVFANVKLNQRLRELDGIDNVYIYPAMGDAGTAAGAALAVAFERHGSRLERRTIESVYLGPAWSDLEIARAVERSGLEYTHAPAIEKEIARLVHEGVVVGHFHGRLEWGPRALGNRSILVRPTDRSINDWLNQRLRRTEFMLFAPSVLAERVADYLCHWRADHLAARFMTITYDVTPDATKRCPAVVHVDDTARPQVVSREDNPRYHAILTEYERLSGLGMLVNTSFNLHESPIVCSPEDALLSLRQGAVDVLAIGDFLVAQTGRTTARTLRACSVGG